MTVRLVAVDLDGTSVQYAPCLSMAVAYLAAVPAWRSKGVEWIMNSDRPPFQMREIALRLPPALRPLALLCRQRDIYLLEGEEYRPHAAWNDAQQARHAALWDGLRPHMAGWRETIETRFAVLERFVDEEAFAFMADPAETPALRSHLEDLVAPWREAQVSGNQDWSFVLHADFSKGRLLREGARLLGVEPSAVVAVGDGYNDVSMLDGSVTPRVGCPANACPEVLAAVRGAGGHVAAAPEAEGTVEVVERYLAEAVPSPIE